MNVSSDKFQVHRILRHLLIRLNLPLAELHFTSAFVVDGREQRLSMQKIAWHVRQQSALDTLQTLSVEHVHARAVDPISGNPSFMYCTTG